MEDNKIRIHSPHSNTANADFIDRSFVINQGNNNNNNNNNEVPVTSKRSKRKWCCIALCIFLVCAGLVLGLGIAYGYYKRNKESEAAALWIHDDIMLTSYQQAAKDAQLALPGDENQTQASSITLGQGKIWPTSTIPFTIMSTVPADIAANLRKAMDTMSSLVPCLKFAARQNEPNYILFKPYPSDQTNGAACASFVGMAAGEPNAISVGKFCGVGQAMHEIMHALGFNHEQVRVDRDQYVEFHPENIDPTLNAKQIASTNYQITQDTTHDTPYDLGSIMHYPLNGFAAPGKQTLILKRPYLGNVGAMKQLSQGDVDALNKLYCKSNNVRPTVAPAVRVARCRKSTDCPINSYCTTDGGCAVCQGVSGRSCANNKNSVDGCTTCPVSVTDCNYAHNKCLSLQFCANVTSANTSPALGSATSVCEDCVYCSPTTSATRACAPCATCLSVQTPNTMLNGKYTYAGGFGDRSNLRPYYIMQQDISTNFFLYYHSNMWVLSFATANSVTKPQALMYSTDLVAVPPQVKTWNRVINGKWEADDKIKVTVTTECPV